MRRIRAALPFLLLAAAAWSPAAAAEPVTTAIDKVGVGVGEVDRTTAGFVHRSSGYAYRSQLGAMPARRSTTYGPGDSEIHYTLYGGASGDSWVGLFVSPAHGLSAAEIGPLIDEAIVKRFQNATATRASGFAPGPAGTVEGWFNAQLEGTPVLTGYRIAVRNGWTIKARVTVPVAGGADALARAKAALAEVDFQSQNLVPAPKPAG